MIVRLIAVGESGELRAMNDGRGLECGYGRLEERENDSGMRYSTYMVGNRCAGQTAGSMRRDVFTSSYLFFTLTDSFANSVRIVASSVSQMVRKRFHVKC